MVRPLVKRIKCQSRHDTYEMTFFSCFATAGLVLFESNIPRAMIRLKVTSVLTFLVLADFISASRQLSSEILGHLLTSIADLQQYNLVLIVDKGTPDIAL